MQEIKLQAKSKDEGFCVRVQDFKTKVMFYLLIGKKVSGLFLYLEVCLFIDRNFHVNVCNLYQELWAFWIIFVCDSFYICFALSS